MPSDDLGKPSMPVDADLHDEEKLKAYFADLEQKYPQVVEAMKVMNISYHQYLVAMQALSPQSSSSNQAEISL